MRSSATAAVACRAIDAVAEQHDLQRLAGNAAQRQIAERFGGEAHAGEAREADRPRLREAPGPRPRARQVPEAAEEERQRQRDAEAGGSCRRRARKLM